jgi:hypothetical protein
MIVLCRISVLLPATRRAADPPPGALVELPEWIMLL